MSLTILLPTYNEAENINPLITAIQKHVPDADILVIDDNSPDGTAKIVKKNKKINILLRKNNRGLTHSLRDGISHTKTEYVGWMDCDFSHPPEIIPKLLATHADIAIARRKSYPLFSNIINSICQICFGRDMYDYTTGFLIAKREVLQNIDLRGNYGEYCIDLLVRAKRKGFKIIEIPYSSPNRLHGQSKTSLKYGRGYLTTILILLWKSEK